MKIYFHLYSSAIKPLDFYKVNVSKIEVNREKGKEYNCNKLLMAYQCITTLCLNVIYLILRLQPPF